MKRGYHSTQSKIYGNIPRSEFYGFVLGYAVGTIIRGIFGLNSNGLQLLLAVIGLGIGVWVDRKYFMEKDEPEEVNEEVSLEEAAGDAEGQQASPPAVEQAATEEIEEESVQKRLKRMFDET